MIHRLVLCLVAVAALSAADAPKKKPVDAKAVAAYNTAFSGDDAAAKKAAAAALGSPSAGDDSDILPLLMAKVEDRQGSDAVMHALRARTGLPAAPVGEGSADRPKRPKDWQAWYGTWQKEQTVKADLAKAEAERAKLTSEVKELAGDKAPDAAADPDATDGAAAVVAASSKPLPDDLGKPVRILFVNGGSMRAYIQSRRLDADGNLISLRIVHAEGGEETLAAHLIARIDEE
jgi:hypothetical protein